MGKSVLPQAGRRTVEEIVAGCGDMRPTELVEAIVTERPETSAVEIRRALGLYIKRLDTQVSAFTRDEMVEFLGVLSEDVIVRGDAKTVGEALAYRADQGDALADHFLKHMAQRWYLGHPATTAPTPDELVEAYLNEQEDDPSDEGRS